MFPNVPQSQPANVCKLLKRLVAGGGFEPQVRIDSTQVIDSVIRANGTIGGNGDSFLHFSYTFRL